MDAIRAITAKHNLILLFMVVLPLVSLAAGLLYILHSPHPRVKAPVAIDRNSLLPHRFAGPCLNCHVILERGPLPLNRTNMDRFNLTQTEEQLLLAGQRVEVPTLGQKLRIPAITRSDILPHDYVGVCSNCHLVLDVRPSYQYMQSAMERAGQHLLELDLTAADMARGGTDADASRPRYRRRWGYAAIPLFVLASVFVVLRLMRSVDPAAFRHGAALKAWAVVHPWAAFMFVVAAVMHFYYSDKGNNFLHLALLALASLTLGGVCLQYRALVSPPKQGGFSIHAQRVLYFTLITLLVLGHLFAEIG